MKRIQHVKRIGVLLLCIAMISSLVALSGCSTVSSVIKKGSSGLYGQLQEKLGANVVRSQNVQTKGDGTDEVTILVYMNGSNLESEDGEASTDLSEMVAAGSSDKVNVVVQTMGTKEWQDYGISGKRSQRYTVSGDGLTLVDDSLGQLDCTASDTLQDFISWGAANYPADRYILMFWNHGGGPVYGFGYDEYQDYDATLTIDEMQQAFKGAGVYFDFIGMDCCIMSSLEVCMAFYDYCDYMILSEDFESGLGWSYTDWLKALYENTSISTVDLGTKAIDAMINANENDKESGSDSILTLIDESVMKVLYTAWTDFAYENEDALLNANYSQQLSAGENGRITPLLAARASGWSWDNDFSDWFIESYTSDYELSDYYVTDIMSVAQNVTSDKSTALSAALDQAIVYTNCTTGDSYLSGISVTLPYGDYSFYSQLKEIFTNCGLDADYIEWLGNFVTAEGSSSFYNYSDYNDSWDGWDSFSDDFDWDSWSYTNDDSYWDSLNDNSDWQDWDYEDSWNSFLDELLDWDDSYSDDYSDDWYDSYYDDYYYGGGEGGWNDAPAGGWGGPGW